MLRLAPTAISKHALNTGWLLAELGASRLRIPTLSCLGPLALNIAYVVFASRFHARHGEWIYPPLARVPWRLAFPVATLPFWMLMRALTRMRDAGGPGSEEEAGWGRLLMNLLTKLALVSLFVVTPAVWLRPHLRRLVPPTAVV